MTIQNMTSSDVAHSNFPTYKQQNCKVQNSVDPPEVTIVNGWTIYNVTSNTTLYARHAYVDRRWNSQLAWHVRIYAVLIGDAIAGRGTLYCTLFKALNDDVTTASVADAYVYERSMKEITIRGRLVHRVMITCRIPELTYPKYVLVTSAAACVTPSSEQLLKIKAVDNSPYDERIMGVCVPLAYGHFNDVDAVRLVEWIEISKLFGVSEINIYNVTMTVTEKYQSVLDYYAEQEVVRIHSIPPPIVDWPELDLYNVSKLADLVVLNECMMENMYRYSYVIVLDFDDVIVPRAAPYASYKNVIESSLVYGQAAGNIASYLVRDVLFYLDLEETRSMPHYLATLRHVVRLGNGQQLTNPKQITNPRLCVHVYIHYCDQVFTADDLHKPAYNLAYVSTHLLLVHHYRKSCKAKWRQGVRHEDLIAAARCRGLRKTIRVRKRHRIDRFMWRYKQRLVENVQPVLTRFDLLDVTSNMQRNFRLNGTSALRFHLPHYQRKLSEDPV